MNKNNNLSINEVSLLTFSEAYNYLQDKDLGDWDEVNSEEIIREYVSEKSSEGIRVSHILAVLEDNPSSEEVYQIWLGNSMETPTPLETTEDLLEALGFEKEYIYSLNYNGEEIDQTSLSEMNENLAYEIMTEDLKGKDKNLLTISLKSEGWGEQEWKI